MSESLNRKRKGKSKEMGKIEKKEYEYEEKSTSKE
jgi:hypothetical protein